MENLLIFFSLNLSEKKVSNLEIITLVIFAISNLQKKKEELNHKKQT